MKKRRLKTLCDVRRLLADLINRLEAGEVTEARAKTTAYVANILRATIEAGDIEERLARLERMVAGEEE